MSEPSVARYLAVPPQGTGPGVLVLHAWWGLNDFIRGLCDRLAEAGFVALAPDLFGGRTAATPAEAEALVRGSSEAADVPPLLLAAASELQSHPAVSGQAIGVIGFSFGGYWAHWLAGELPEAVRAVTIFYSTGDSDVSRSTAAFQGHFAERDPYEPAEGVRWMEANIRTAGRPVTFFTYPGTGHWFFESDRANAYDPQAAGLAWERTLAFLREGLGGPVG
jgi:carboxymethylenebutenolidase